MTPTQSRLYEMMREIDSMEIVDSDDLGTSDLYWLVEAAKQGLRDLACATGEMDMRRYQMERVGCTLAHSVNGSRPGSIPGARTTGQRARISHGVRRSAWR